MTRPVDYGHILINACFVKTRFGSATYDSVAIFSVWCAVVCAEQYRFRCMKLLGN
jgi:hypothetical protein